MAQRTNRALSHTDYTVACICPMGVELAPVEAMLDKTHDSLPTDRDYNAYITGEIGDHNVVIAVMPEIGNNAAATVATQLMNDFPAIRFGFLVGIGGGVPGPENEDDIRLGDVVVGQPIGVFNGVVQYDLGKKLADGRFARTGQLNKPPAILSANVRKLQGRHLREGSQITTLVSDMMQRYPRMRATYTSPGPAQDCLYRSSYTHVSSRNCDQCDRDQTLPRSPRTDLEPRIHYGTIGSANMVVKDASTRDELKKDMNILCVEMEAAGLMDDFPCLVIRGICDYADSHKNKIWQPYAAAVAAGYMKELLMAVPVQQVALALNAANVPSSPFELGLHLGEAPLIDANFFVGRSDELNEMKRILRPGEDSQQHQLSLGGMGGVGKTQLAIAYAESHRNTYSSIWWINASTRATADNGLRTIAQSFLDTSECESLDDEQIVVRVRRWLSDPANPRWLLIFDNHDDPRLFDVRRYFAHAAHGSIVITTRLPDLVGGSQIHLQPLKHIDDGLQILAARSGRQDVHSDHHARRLVDRLGGLPLALATVGTYLKKSTLSFRQYLQEYERRWNLNPRRPVELHEYRDRTLYNTWDLSYARLEEEDSNAAKLLKLLAYFDNQDIRHTLLCAGTYSSAPSWLFDTIAESVDFENTMSILVEHSFVEVHSNTLSFSMHACIHDWTLGSLNKTIDNQSYWYAFGCCANSVDRQNWEQSGHLQYAYLLPHAIRLAHGAFIKGRVFENAPDDWVYNVPPITKLLHEHRQLAAAAVLFEPAVMETERIFGSDHVTTLGAINNLGLIYTDQGRLDEAEETYTRALSRRESILGPDDPSTLQSVSSLGSLYRQQDRLEDAERMYIRALEGRNKVFGPNDASVLDMHNSLGNLYRDQGKLEEAELSYLRAIVGQVQVLGSDDLTTLLTMHNLALLYLRRGEAEKAEPLCTCVVNGNEAAFGPDHPSTLDCVNTLAILSHQLGQLEKAEALYVRVLSGYKKALGPEETRTSVLGVDYNLWSLRKKKACLEQERLEAERVVEVGVGVGEEMPGKEAEGSTRMELEDEGATSTRVEDTIVCV